MSIATKAAVTISLSFVHAISPAGVLYPDTILYMNQAIVSGDQKYALVMQPDGNLVMYRADGTARWASNTHGWYAIMQGDGNFVVYNTSYIPQFNTGTGGHRGAFLAVQDDGNLVVYSASGVPLWWIGGDIPPADPKAGGDLVGRDLGEPVVGSIGHIGIFDGDGVIEATSESRDATNAIQNISLQDFKKATKYWGAATPKIPSDWQLPECYDRECNSPGQFKSVLTRAAIAARAYQIKLIGADYTLFPTSTVPALPGYPGRKPFRGRYRCDTFVLDAYTAGTYPKVRTEQNRNWRALIWDLSNGTAPVLPAVVFDRLKDFK